VIASVGQGDVVGEIGVLVTGARTASVVAMTPMPLPQVRAIQQP
jgi:CRP-like cAMP-binding protein